MAKDPEKESEYQDLDEREDEIGVKEVAEVAEVTDPDHPRCPRCGWHNTRLSLTTTILDSILRTFALHAFRCRSCGNRFRVLRRTPKV
jgi:tRNA(Ile2) C34 agmatinyltransferase TiaS